MKVMLEGRKLKLLPMFACQRIGRNYFPGGPLMKVLVYICMLFQKSSLVEMNFSSYFQLLGRTFFVITSVKKLCVISQST